jgi:RND family efflux transporter MFP subunit
MMRDLLSRALRKPSGESLRPLQFANEAGWYVRQGSLTRPPGPTARLAQALLGVAALLIACGRDTARGGAEAGAATMGMTAEEHARMLAGQTGATDTAGQALRQPVHLTAEQARAIGVTYTTVERGPLLRTVRTVGQVVPAEPNLAEITSKIEGFVEELFVDVTGALVEKGQPLLGVYSPMLVAAQEELLTARRLAAQVDSTAGEAWADARATLEAARRRLLYWDISADQVERLEQTEQVTKTLVLRAPFDGVVLEKAVVAGQAVSPGMNLYRLADLARVWIEGAVFEQDLAFVRVGASVRADIATYPGRTFTGRVSFVWPTLDTESRTARLRVEFSNPGGRLKPGMYATLLVDALVGQDVVHVPAQSVVMTGERNLVFVVTDTGALEPREVTVGQRAGERIQILDGVEPGQRIVASANFLVDAESRLGTGTGMAGMPGMPDMPMPGERKKP